jgi:predicted ABC-type ATPase
VPNLAASVQVVLQAQTLSGKPLAVVVAGHNGSGKSTLWYENLAKHFQIPLINADRMMLSILPEVPHGKALPEWAKSLRDGNVSWMKVAQQGVQAFVAQAMAANVPFAMETVFSQWTKREDGTIASKLDLIEDMQNAGYFVLLLFVGLANADLSIARVSTRAASGGHNVPVNKLLARFPRTQKAVAAAAKVADATIMTDNSREPKHAFSVCRIQLGEQEIYDRRKSGSMPPEAVLQWLNIVSPRA